MTFMHVAPVNQHDHGRAAAFWYDPQSTFFKCFGLILFFYQWQRFTQSQTQHYSRQACLTFPDAQDQQQARESKSHHVFANSLHTGLLTAVGISSVAEHLHGMQIPAD